MIQRYGPISRLALSALVALAAGGVQATPIAYLEPGDFSGNVAAPSIVVPALDVGLNTIVGDARDLPGDTDWDIFVVTLLPGQGSPANETVFDLLFSPDNVGAVSFHDNGTFPMAFSVGTRARTRSTTS